MRYYNGSIMSKPTISMEKIQQLPAKLPVHVSTWPEQLMVVPAMPDPKWAKIAKLRRLS